MKIKTLFKIVFTLCITMLSAQNSLQIPSVSASIGEKTKINIDLTNSDPIIGVEFTLVVPKGLIVYDKESILKQDRKGEDHVLFTNLDKDGNYHFMVFSYTNKVFKGNRGTLIEIPIEIPITYKDGQSFDILLKNVIVSSTKIQDVGSNHQGGKLLIKKDFSPDLEVSEVTTLGSEAVPDKKLTASWKVKNLGKKIAVGGWTEQVYLVSEINDQKYLLGSIFYKNDLNQNDNIIRQGEFKLPKIIGFDGNCKLEVNIIAESSVKEPDSDKDNNKALSANSIFLNKVLFIETDKNKILENSEDKIKILLNRSGDISKDQTFTIQSSIENQFALPESVTIKNGASTAVIYAKPIDNTNIDGDRTVRITFSGNDYKETFFDITIIDDEIPSFNITASSTNLNPGDKSKITLHFMQVPSTDIKINLETDYNKRLKIPDELLVKAGMKEVSFDVEAIETKVPEAELSAKITARAVGYKQESIDIKLNKANIPSFEFIISPTTISEGDGTYATTAIIRRLDNTESNATLLLKTDIADALLIPSKLVFTPGQTQKKFSIGVVDNSIVDSTRVVTVTASLYIPGCGCSGASSGISGTEYKSKVTILDNDGLSLTVKANPSTVKAGIKKAAKIIISRNTVRNEDLTKSLLVKLSSDSPTILEIPQTVEIPSGKQSVEVTINTLIDPTIKGDQTIRIQAEAQDYNSGFGWILVTDQNKPDAIINSIIAPETVEGGQVTEISIEIKNQGFSVLPKGMKIEYYLSTNTSIKDLKPFDEAVIENEINPGKSIDFKHTIQLPDRAGSFNLVAVLNSDKNIEELTYTNNESYKEIELKPSYTADIQVDRKVYKPGEIITMKGSAKYINGSLAANKPVEISINNGGFVRSFTIKTNATGNFAYDFAPLQGENGFYEIAAGYPGMKVKAQDDFNLLGVEWVNKPSDYLKWEVTEGQRLEGEFKLKNNTRTTLTNIQVKLPAAADFKLETKSLNLNAGEEGVLKYTLIPNSASSVRKYYEIRAEFISDEGAKTPFTSWYYCHTEKAKLIVDPVTINTSMVKGKSRLYEVKVVNIGSTEAKNIKIDVPKLEWLKLKSPEKIDKLGASDTLKIVLELKPTDKQQINVPLKGNIALNLSNGNGISIPFTIETVSENKGTLQIDVVDEYTYNTEKAPHVQGAKVIVRHPYTGVIVAQGITDSTGIFSAENLPEGWYSVLVSANKHDSYQNNFEIEPGKTNRKSVFLSYQAVSYEWNVKPTEIEDQYEMNLDVTFETNVPKPVLVVDIDQSIIKLETGQSMMSYVTVTNHGLINALDAKISISQINGYKLTPLIDRLDVIQAKSSVIIPVLIEKIPESKFNFLPCFAIFDIRALFPCGPSLADIIASGNFKVFGNCESKNDPPKTPINTPDGPNYPKGNGNIDIDPWSIPTYITNLPNICDSDKSCVISVVNTFFTCVVGTIVAPITCTVSIATSTDLIDLSLAVGGCITSGKLSCAIGIGSTLKTCIIDELLNKTYYYSPDLEKLTFFYKDFEAFDKADKAQDKRIKEIFNEENWRDNYDFKQLLLEVANFLDNDKKFSINDIARIKSNLINTYFTDIYIDKFCDRWNSSIDAWNIGILSPNKEYPNIISKDSLVQYKLEIENFNKYVNNRGYNSAEKMLQDDLDFFEELNNELQESNKSSVCATISVRFSQKMTMTREAFEGTLEINNSSSKEIKNINLNLVITDENNKDVTHLFQINKDEFLNGSGIVGANSNGIGTVIYIPTKEAAPTVSKSYSFGGTLSYLDPETGEKVSAKLFPVTLEVNPSPDLVLHYFMQRDIIGDDPLTEKVEPMVPAEMSLLIKNEGYGTAKNVQVQSMQPEIIENRKGLLIDFEMIGSRMNNQPKQLGLLNIDFGSIAPQKAMVGQWWFTSTLLGHFVKYDIKVKHLNSYGNKDLSLIKEYHIHELIKSVKAYGKGQDDISDFLVNDIPDLNDTPDMIYYSNGESEEVSQVSAAKVTNEISPSQVTTQLSITPSFIGWNYGNITDPGKDLYKLIKVIRNSDNLELPIENFWQTFVTLRDGKDPKYENKLHFVDKVEGTTTYTLYYTPIDTNVPKVVSFANILEQTTTQPVEYVEVHFNKPIQKQTFSYKNLRLIHQGAEIKLSQDNVKIGISNDSVFVVDLKALTRSSGYYELTVQCAGIKDLKGNEGKEGKSVSWTQVIGELGIMQFTSDQLNSQPLNSIEIIFNKKIASTQFNKEKISLNGKPLENITITNVAGGIKYTLSGLNEYNVENGNYELEVNLPEMVAEDGSKGLIVQKFSWKVDKNLPEVDQFELQYQGAVHAQNVTDVLITLNKPITSEFLPEWVQLIKGTENQKALITVIKQDELHYLVSELGNYTQSEGSYKLLVNQEGFIDEFGNYGTGSVNKNWTVRFEKPLSVINMHLTPDRGISSTDNITSGDDVMLQMETVEDHRKVIIYMVTISDETIIQEIVQDNKGMIEIPVGNFKGKNKFKAIVYDSYGNASSPVVLDTYIDGNELSANFLQITKRTVSCSEIEHIKLNFTEDIVKSDLNVDALVIESAGIKISGKDLKINSISDREFEISNLESLKNNGDISLGVNLNYLHKKISGLQGNGIASIQLGEIQYFESEISGSETSTVNAVENYVAASNMNSYKWTVTGGEIINENKNVLSVKWKEKGDQTITLEYQTPTFCNKSTSIKVKVDNSLSIDEIEITDTKTLKLVPVPNKGIFTLLMKGKEGNFNLSIYDLSGRKIYSEEKIKVTDNFKKLINVSPIQSGVYYLILHNSKEAYKLKFTVE
ncbi:MULTISPECIES: CARDB domain-containing protein [unclassified Apibacter]|uniref:CARDB domain-containing protein n=1 Tax=unclassified Apibacter TaxID=2630820 RepID=UPI00135E3B30|nr:MULTISPECIES: CARDB domain-containing protein [unclassified Apibacter]MXP05431.1 T9SS type A sorting domain-containing protein [Apibacter sp. B3546]MXP12398.1 T9SS type A sorting domain-containing protein [Apibacter sp. B3239]